MSDIPTLPASSNSNSSVNALCRMKRPVINNFGVFLLSLKQLTINIEWDLRELHWHCIVMPFIVTNLQHLHFKVRVHNHFCDFHDTDSVLISLGCSMGLLMEKTANALEQLTSTNKTHNNSEMLGAQKKVAMTIMKNENIYLTQILQKRVACVTWEGMNTKNKTMYVQKEICHLNILKHRVLMTFYQHCI